MIPALPQNIQDELAQLARSYNQPLVRTIDLETHSLFDPLSSTDRYGEVCMVVRRKNGCLLTMTKTFYPEGAYRLPTGGIKHGEPILDALLRETYEETALEVEVKHFLAVAAYRVISISTQPVFYTFAFLLDEIGGTLGAIDEDEKVEDFREVAAQDLPTMASFLERLGDRPADEIHGNWDDWGKFRSVIHHLVWEALPV